MKVFKNQKLNDIYEQLEAGQELPDCLLKFLQYKISQSLFLCPPQNDDYIEFSVLLHDYVCYIDSRQKPRILEKGRYFYLKQLNKL